jgi:hypothetical protein
MAKDDEKQLHVTVTVDVHDHGPDEPCPRDSEVVFDESGEAAGGPAGWNNNAFRSGWERTFGKDKN